MAVAEPEPLPAEASAAATREAQVAADDVALLLGRNRCSTATPPPVHGWRTRPLPPTGSPTPSMRCSKWSKASVPPLTPASALSDDDVDRIALRVAAVVATDATLAARLEASIVDRVAPAVTAAAERAVERLAADAVAAVVDRVVRDLAAPIVEASAHAAVRDEIARMRGATRGA